MCGLHQIVFYGFGKKGKLVYDKHLYYEFKFLFKDELWQQAYPLSSIYLQQGYATTWAC